MSRKGFTLVELMMVTVIIALLVIIALPKLGAMKDRSRVATMQSDLRNLMTAQEAYFESEGTYSTSIDNLPNVINISKDVDIDLWEIQGQGFGWRARARLIGRPSLRCGVLIGHANGNPSVPGIGQVEEGKIACVGL